MDNERTRDQQNSSGKPRGDRGHGLASAAHGFFLLESLLMLSTTVFIAIGVPQALAIAAYDANASAATFADPESTDQGERALEEVEKEYEPLITDDLRSKGLMYAVADAPGAIGS